MQLNNNVEQKGVELSVYATGTGECHGRHSVYGRVSVSHACSFSFYSESQLQNQDELHRQALPFYNLYWYCIYYYYAIRATLVTDQYG